MSDIKVPVQRRAIEKKSKLIESAKIVLNKKGYHGTYIKEITSEAGISVGSFYKYFKDKDDIYTEVIKVLIDKELTIINELKEALEVEKLSWLLIRDYIIKRIDAIKFHNIIAEFHTVIKDSEQNSNLINDAKSKYIDVISEILLSINNEMTDDELHVVSLMLWRTLYGNIIEIVKIDNHELKELYIDNLTDMIFKYIKIND